MAGRTRKSPTLEELAANATATETADADEAELELEDDPELDESADDSEGEVEVADGSDDARIDESGDNITAGDTTETGIPMEPGERLVRLFAKFIKNWDTNYYFVDIYRDMPQMDSEGNRITGQIGRASKPIDINWLRENYGGGTYRVYLRGPRQSRSGWSTSVIRGQVRGIVVGGRPFINNRSPDSRGGNADDAGQGPGTAAANAIYSQVSELQNKLIEMSQKLAEDKANAKSGDVAAAVSLLKETNAQTGALLRDMMTRADKRDPTESVVLAKAIEALGARRDDRGNDERAQALIRDMQQRARDEVSSVRDEAARERKELRETYDLRERALRDEMDRREKMLKDTFSSQEKHTRDQLAEARARVGTLEALVETLRSAALEARIAANAAEIRASVAGQAGGSTSAGGVTGIRALASELQQLKEVAPMLGLGSAAPEEPSQMQQIVSILNTDAAKRVGEGVRTMLSGLGNRGNVAPPTPDAVNTWQQARAGLQGGTQVQQLGAGEQSGQAQRRRVVRRNRTLDTTGMAPGTPIVPPVAHYSGSEQEDVVEVDVRPAARAEQPQAQPAPQPAPQPQAMPEQLAGIDPALVAAAASGQLSEEQSAQVVMQVVESAAATGTTPAEFAQQVAPLLGGPEIVAFAKMQGADAVIEQIEAACNDRLSTAARQLVRDALEVA